jgi:hypothetical protein
MQTPKAKHMSNQNRVLQREATFLRELRWVDAGCTGESKRGRESPPLPSATRDVHVS